MGGPAVAPWGAVGVVATDPVGAVADAALSGTPVREAAAGGAPAHVDSAREHASLVTRLHEVLDGLVALGPGVIDALDDDELRTASASLSRAKARIDGVLMPLARGLHERDVARATGAASTGVLLANDFGGDRPSSARLVRTARHLSNAPATEQALGAGNLLGEQARIIAAAMTRLPYNTPRDDRKRLEQWLIGQADGLSIEDLARAATRSAEAFRTRAEADAHEDDELAARERRARRKSSFWMADNRDGTWRGAFVLPDAEAEALRVAVEAISAPRRNHLTREAQADPAAKSGAGPVEDPGAPSTDYVLGDRRNREGRAFAAICSLLPADRLPAAGGISAVVTVNVDYDALTGLLGPGTLPSGARISAGKVRQWACTAGIIPQVLGGKPLPLDLGQSQRYFSAAQRRALAQRDRGCVFPGCDRPPQWCEGHHWRDPWTPRCPDDPHGATDLDNGCLMCAVHHRRVHDDNIAMRERGGYLELLVPPQRIKGSGWIRGPGRYDGDLLSAGSEASQCPDDNQLANLDQRRGSGLQWQRNHRWRP